MPNLTAKLNLTSSGGGYSQGANYSTSRTYNTALDKTYVLDGNVVRLFEVDPTADVIKAAISVPSKVPAPKLSNVNFLKVCNVGVQTLEFGVAIADANKSTDVFTDVAGLSNAPNLIWMSLNPGDFFVLPTSKVFLYNSVDADSTIDHTPGMGNGDGKSGSTKSVGATLGFTATGTGIFDVPASGANPVTHGSTITAATTTITTAANGTVPFKVNDVIASGTEAMLVTAIASTTSMTVERGYRGTTAADISGGSELKFYLRQRTGDTDVTTDRKGNYYNNNFFGYGRDDAKPDGIVPGSTAIRFYSLGGYQNFGLSDITPSTKTGLAASTTYTFRVQVDGSTETDSSADIQFTTDASNKTFGGATGIIAKIQAVFDAHYFDSTKDMFNKRVTIGIVDGDIRVQSHSNLSTTKIELEAPSTGTTPFGVGRILAVGNLPASVISRVPDSETEQNQILFDNGNGTMTRAAGGTATINYETGEIHLTGCPPIANMEVSGVFNNALSGHVRGDKDNHIFSAYARSLSQFRDAQVRVIAYDTGIDDSVTYQLPAKARY